MRGRSSLLCALAALVAVAGTSLPAIAKKAKPSPSPVARSQNAIPPGYYLVASGMIVSPRYPTLPACLKDLNDAKHRMIPGSDSAACIHKTQ